MASRILFVDDEPGIRLTLPTILRQHGYAVTAVASVAEAIQKLSNEPFEVLVADLNVGEPGDGFTVVSAMRRVQPKCVNIILTGYPAFENALRAIRSQVDDFLVKPAEIPDLVASIEKRLSAPEALRNPRRQPLVDCLREQADEVVRRALERMKANPRLAKIAASDEERMDHIKTVVAEILRQLERGPQPEIQTRAGARMIRATLPGGDPAVLGALPGVVSADRHGDAVLLSCSDADTALRALLGSFPAARDIEVRGGSLEEAFLELTADNETASPVTADAAAGAIAGGVAR